MKAKRNLRAVIIAIVIIIIFLIFTLLTIISLTQADQPSSNVTATFVSSNNSEDNNTTIVEENTTEITKEARIYANVFNLRSLINNNWSRINANFSGEYEKDEDGNYVYEGYTMYCSNGTFIRNIVFNSDFEDVIVGELTIEATEDEIIEKCGTPHFRNSEIGMIGYKAEIGYIFFSEGEVSIYPNLNLDNDDFEELLFEYVLGTFDGNQTVFVKTIKDNFDDFTAELDDDGNVVLSSIARGIEIVLNETYNETEINLYEEYKIGDTMESYYNGEKDYKYIIDNSDEYLTEIVETERILMK